MSVRLEAVVETMGAPATFWRLWYNNEIVGWIQEERPGIVGRLVGKKSLFLYGSVMSTKPFGDADNRDWALALLLVKLRSDPKFGG